MVSINFEVDYTIFEKFQEIKNKVNKKNEEVFREMILNKIKELEQGSTDIVKHNSRIYEKFCADCGERNPEYRPPMFKCRDCDVPYLAWSLDEIKTKVCWSCGGKNLREID